MSDRRSIDIAGLSHLTEIPVASRVGPLLASSVIAPFNPGTREVPEAVADQVSNIFRHVGKMLEAAGGSFDDVAKMDFWVPSPELRDSVEAEWVTYFPDARSRPARHTHVAPGKNVTASFIAWIGDN